MRIEIDAGLQKLLDQVKTKEPSVYGRGHVETVRFLANYYVHHKPLEDLLVAIRHSSAGFINNLDVNIEASLTRVLPKAAGRAISTLLALSAPQDVRSKDAQQPQKAGDPEDQAPGEVR